MLEHTFCHINGIGEATERRIWNSGILNWSDWQEPINISLSKQARIEIPAIFEASLDALENGDPHFFCNRLKSGDAWRIFPHFKDRCAYLDIETTGLRDNAEITTIALYDGIEVRTYVNGKNLDNFPHDIMAFDVLISYNGKSFDIPFIENYFRISLPQAQIDLRFVLSAMGIKGGLKSCEHQMGINRGGLEGVDGAFAVQLWHYYERYGDEKALETLLAYNVEDTVNLERLLVEAVNRRLEHTPFCKELSLPFPKAPQLPYHPDHECVVRVKNQVY